MVLPALAQLLWLFVLSGVVACVAWTVTHEKVFEEVRDWCERQSENRARPWWVQKWFYLFTCEYCFSHYVTAFFLFVTRFTLLMDGWRGYLLSFFAVVFVANIYMSLYSRLRVDIRSEKAAADLKETEKDLKKKVVERADGDSADGVVDAGLREHGTPV